MKLLDFRLRWEVLALGGEGASASGAHPPEAAESCEDCWIGDSREDVRHLARYIDWIMTLPTQLEERFKTTLEEEAQEKKMSFMTVWERHGHEEGLRKGIHQEGVAAVLEVLEERFGSQSNRLRRDLERIEDARRLRRLLRRAVSAETLAVFEEDLRPVG